MKVYESHATYIPPAQKYQNVLFILKRAEMSY